MPFENRTLEAPEILFTIGAHFRDSSEVPDDDVVATLRDARQSRLPSEPIT